VHDIRRVAYQLRPPTLDALGLVEAVRAHVSETPNLSVRVDAPRALRPLPAAVEVAAYRITLEALHNVTGHAQAQHCIVTIRQQPNILTVEVTDNGCGITADHHPGLGLSSMRERATEIGGTMTITTNPTGGTSVRALLPTIQQRHGQTADGA
jgi:signal transduction histidine kinase